MMIRCASVAVAVALLAMSTLLAAASGVGACGINEAVDPNGHYVFDGTTSYIGTGTLLPVVDWGIHSDWSFSAWLKPNPNPNPNSGTVTLMPVIGTLPAVTDALTSNTTLAVGFRFDGSTNTDFVIAIGVYQTLTGTYDYTSDVISSVSNVDSDSDPASDAWAFYVITYSAQSAVFTAWRNGQPLALNAGTGSSIAGTFQSRFSVRPSALTIGAAGRAVTQTASAVQLYTGRMDDIRVWPSIQLSDNQVSSLYCSSNGDLGQTAPPVAPVLYLDGSAFPAGATVSTPQPALSGVTSAAAGLNECYGSCPNINSTFCVVVECYNGYLSFDVLHTGAIMCACFEGYIGVTCDVSTVECNNSTLPCATGHICVSGVCQVVIDPLTDCSAPPHTCPVNNECISGTCRPVQVIHAVSSTGAAAAGDGTAAASAASGDSSSGAHPGSGAPLLSNAASARPVLFAGVWLSLLWMFAYALHATA